MVGAGIGLADGPEIVERQAGLDGAESSEGSGSAVHLRSPLGNIELIKGPARDFQSL